MLAGNLLALSQTNVKRIFAFSSISHMGYMLVALLAGGALGAPAATYYLAAYAATILGAFGLMIILSGPRHEAASIDDYRGLFWKRPLAAGAFTTMLFHLPVFRLLRGSSASSTSLRQALQHPGGFSCSLLSSAALSVCSTIYASSSRCTPNQKVPALEKIHLR